MNILRNSANTSNPLIPNRMQSDNPMANTFTRKIEKMQERVNRIRDRQQEAMKSRMVEEKLQRELENSTSSTEEAGLSPILTKAIVSNDMALNRINDTYRTRAGIVSQIEREGATNELQDALARTTITLAAQIGEVFNNIEKYNDIIASKREQQENERQSGDDGGGVQIQPVSAYTTPPPSGLVVDIGV